MLKKITSSILIIIILTLWMPIQAIKEVFTSVAIDLEPWEYSYTGEAQTFTAPHKAMYQIELYGAQGYTFDENAIGSKGSYVKGNIVLEKGESLNIYVGGQNGYNGGGNSETLQGNGGGATDIRYKGKDISNRILVAAGGGGSYKEEIYHKHTGSSSSGGGCYTTPVYHTHTSGCYSQVKTNCGWRGSDDHAGEYDSCPRCGSGVWKDYQESSPHYLFYCKGNKDYYTSQLTCGRGGAIDYYNIACGKIEGETIDSYSYINGKTEELSNNELYQGSVGGGGGYYGGQTQYIGTSYINTASFTETQIQTLVQEGNGYAKITLIETYPEVDLSANITTNTNQNVILTATIPDMADIIETPYSWNGGTRVNQNKYIATKNGTYTVNVINTYGNTAEKSYTVNNIDKIAPTINSAPQLLSQDKKSTTITIKAMDYSSDDYISTGIVGYAITQENVEPTEFSSTNAFIVSENGTYYGWAKDAVGNISKARTILVPDIEIEILGNITWNDTSNKYSSRKASNIKLYRKLGENGTEELVETQRLEPGQTTYSFQTRQCDDLGNEYTFRLEQELIDGYETLYEGNNVTSDGTKNVEINITNNLILPTYTSKIEVEAIDSFENKLLKNGKIKLTATIEASKNNREEIGIHKGQAILNIDSNIKVDEDSIIVTYEDIEGNKTNITNYSINSNTITTIFGKDNQSISTKGSKLTIEVIGTLQTIGTYNNQISLNGKLRDYRGTNTNIDVGTITQNEKQSTIEYQLPEANIQIRKVDSITEETLTDAIFTLYEWDGSKYIEKETITDTNKDGIYESKVYRWNYETQGKYKIVETSIPKYHEDLNFSMEYTLTELHDQNYIVTVDYNNTNYAIKYGKRDPDDLNRINGIVENEPWKLKAQIEKIDKETNKQIVSDTEFTIYEWNKYTTQYEEYTSYLNGQKVDFIRQEDGTYITKEWLYYTPKNEGKYRIIETKAPKGYYANYDPNSQKVVYDINILESIENGTYNNQNVENEATIKIENNNNKQITNERVKATLNVNVVDSETKSKSQADSSLENAKYGIYALEEIKHSDGKTTRYEEEPGLLYKQDELVDVQNTNKEGKITFDNLECGIYYIKMIEPPEGYLLDETKYMVDFSYQGEERKHIELTGQIEIQVKKQAFQLYKLKENEEVLSNAGFSIYLINDLSIVKEGKITKVTTNTYTLNDENAKLDERLQGKQNSDGTYNLTDLIDFYYKINYTEEEKQTLPGDNSVYHPYQLYNETYVTNYSSSQEGSKIEEIRTDSKGYLKSPELAYGEYIVLETSVPREQQVTNSFIVKVVEDSRNAQELRFVIDKDFKTRVKIYTKDARTKNTILNKNAYYVIKNEETGKYMTKISWNGTKFVEKGTIENPFESKDSGYFITPMDLPIGKYVLEEVTAPNGYVVNGKEGYSDETQTIYTPKEKVRFEIKSNAIYYMDNYLGRYIVVVEQENEESLGTIIIKSQGEYLAKVEENDSNYKFEYETRPIEKAEYEIFAKEDIYTQDNQKTLIYSKDEKIAKVTTNENREAIIQNLPQGKYYIKQKINSYGFSSSNEENKVEISYQGQEVPVIFANKTIEEKRQTVTVTINNIDNQTKETISGGEYGIYTKEEIVYETKEGKTEIIPANTLLYKTKANENGQIKFSKVENIDLPIGIYVVKELEAPSGYIKTQEEIQILAIPNAGEEQININITQEKEKTKIKIRNIDKNVEKILGAKIEIKDENQNVVRAIESLDELNKIEGLESKKTYTLETTKPANGYITNEKIEFYLEEDGTLKVAENYQDKELTNTIIIISEKTKLNIVFKDKLKNIRNINFVIKEQGTSNILASTKESANLLKIEENEQGYFVEKLPIGKYTLVQEEIPYEEGYTEKQTINIDVQDIQETQEVIVEQPISKLLIKITDETSKELIKDVEVQILNKNEEIIATTEEKENALKVENTEEGYLVERIPVGECKISKISKEGYKTIETKEIKVEDTKEEQLQELTTRQLIINIELDKKLENILVNGQKTKADENAIMKVEIKERKISTTTLELEYKIVVTNKGEVETSVEKIIDKIPSGLICEANKNPDWNVSKEEAVYKESIILKPNESKELTIIMKWKNSKTNFGETKNTAQAIGISNKYNYKNENSSNSTDLASIVISVGTGLEEKVTIVRIIIIALTACMVICLFAGIEIIILNKRKNK